MKNLLYILAGFILLSGCNTEEFFDGPSFFEDDFESYADFDDLFLDDDLLWSFFQITRDENSITIDTSFHLSGSSSMKFTASPTMNGDASKSSIVKQNMAFWEGETVRLSAWYYIEGTESLEWLFLMDLEEQVAVGAGPGMRLAHVNNQLRVEHKYLEDDILQIEGQETDLPRNQWVEIIWEVNLSISDNGTVKLWQNGQLIIDSKNNKTLPTDLLYFQQGTKGMYSSCEVGITANSEENDLTIWVDDIKFEKVE